ncbi:MAG: UDP-N-acetylmuramate dehydrogenase [Chloroflexi bacterium]|nr:UDP-N-acetylmuramate dehydrogenase [Chloroflexota bacterium]
MTTFDGFASELGDRLQRDVPLAKFTAARLGGPADWLYMARSDTDELTAVVRAAWAAGLPVRVIGGGANVLVSDLGVRGLVVINKITRVEAVGEGLLQVSAGTPLTYLCRECAARGLRGFEWAVAVPGTLGGAAINNAGAHGGAMRDTVVSATVVEPESAREWSAADLAYDYRHSALKSRADRRYLLTGALLRFDSDDPAAISARMDEYNAYRKRTQPPGASLGSVFKNPPGDYAGRLIEAAGLKGFRIGSAQVSPIHANFFLNEGGSANAADYYALVRHVQAAVLAHSGISLEPEIEFVGAF